MEKIKKYKEIIIVILVVVVGSFYWFQLRPTMIKRECSWVKDIIPADLGVTKEQAAINKVKLSECIESARKYDEQDNSQKGFFQRYSSSCFVPDTEERQSQPEKVNIREANKGEYDKCLRQHGL